MERTGDTGVEAMAPPGRSARPAGTDAGADDTLADLRLTALPEAFYADPFPSYRALRERDPIHRMPDGSFFLTRYRDLEAIYKDTARFSSDKKIEFKPKFGDSLLFEHHTTSLVFNDPPLHTRVRRLIAGALNPRTIAEMEPGLVALIDRLLDEAKAKPGAPASGGSAHSRSASGEVDERHQAASATPWQKKPTGRGAPSR